MPGTRTEKDLLGSREVPQGVLWGVHTLRARENLRSPGPRSARTNHGDQFVVDPLQGGAGTSTNMNANEVVANVAITAHGGAAGDYSLVDPHEHVNLSQSTNDAYPTAIRLALIDAGEDLVAAVAQLANAFRERGVAFGEVLKLGRTQLQDAVPMTLGQEFHAFATMLEEDVERLRESLVRLHEVNLGGTAIGTGIAAPPGFAAIVVEELASASGLPLRPSRDLIEAGQDTGALVLLSGMIRRTAVKMSKICNDLRLLSSVPSTGFGEIRLPPRQAGSSLMPGKINPVIPEMVSQVAFEVIGRDVTVTVAAEAGQLQLNAFEPVIVHALLTSITRLARAAMTLADQCVAGISANVPPAPRRWYGGSGIAEHQGCPGR